MTIRILNGDCRDVLPTLPDESVHCVVTSPPYWGLRDYKLPPAVWGGAADCAHEWGDATRDTGRGSGFQGKNGQRTDRAFPEQRETIRTRGNICVHCGAWRGCLGLEPDYPMFVEHMIEVFREVKRVLRPDGTLWLNLGDSYASGKGTCFNPGGNTSSFNVHLKEQNVHPLDRGNKSTLAAVGLKPKDLVGIPWRVAFALQADGWYLRQDIIWSKPNPMPESVRDRCTKAHEYIFLLSKSQRYYFDQDAIAEPSVTDDIRRPYGSEGAWQMDGRPQEQRRGGQPRSYNGSTFTGGKTAATKPNVGQGDSADKLTRNKRSVWEIATQPFSEAHFATFPPALIEPCILAGCPKGGTVLDPFGGAGTTGLVADRLQRNAILIELNPAYAEMAANRVTNDAPLFGAVE